MLPMRRHYAAVLVPIVLLAGCTAIGGDGGDSQQSTRVTPNDGLTVDFGPAKSEFPENEVLQFGVRVANTGEADATNISTSLFGSPFLSAKRCPKPLQGPNGIIQNDIQRSDQPQSTDNWKCYPPAEKDNVSTQLVELPVGATDSYNAGLEIAYNYTTEASTRLAVTTPSRIQSSSPGSTENSAAPVKATINIRSPQPVQTDGTLDIPITIRNVGDGKTIPPKTVKGNMRYGGKEINVTVKGPLRGKKRSSGRYTATTTVSLVGGSRQVILPLQGFTLPQNAENLRTSYPIEVTLQYRYRERVSRPFTVSGQPAGVKIETLEQAQPPSQAGPGEGLEGPEGREGPDRKQVTQEGTHFVVTRTRDAGKKYTLAVSRPFRFNRDDLKVQVAALTANGNANSAGWRDCTPVKNAGKTGHPLMPCTVEDLQIKTGQDYMVRALDTFDKFHKDTDGFVPQAGTPQGKDGGITDPELVDVYVSSFSGDEAPYLANFTVRLRQNGGVQKVTKAAFMYSGSGKKFSACTPAASATMYDGQTNRTTAVGPRPVNVTGGYFNAEEGSAGKLWVDGFTCGDILFACVEGNVVQTVSGSDRVSQETTCFKGSVPYRARIEHNGDTLRGGKVKMLRVENVGSHNEKLVPILEKNPEIPQTFEFGGTFSGTELPYIGTVVEFRPADIPGCGPARKMRHTIGRAQVHGGGDPTRQLQCDIVLEMPSHPVKKTGGPPKISIGTTVTIKVAATHFTADIKSVTIDNVSVGERGSGTPLIEKPKSCSQSSCSLEFESKNAYGGEPLYVEATAATGQAEASNTFRRVFE